MNMPQKLDTIWGIFYGFKDSFPANQILFLEQVFEQIF